MAYAEVRAMGTGERRPGPATASTWLLPALLALLVAGCGQGAGTGGASSSASVDPQDQARLYAQCMRANGVADFPDPDPNGRFSLSHGEGGVDQDDPKVQAAMERCRALAPGGEHQQNIGDPAFVEAMRAFSQCMRDNGLPEFPDPDADGRLRGAGHEAGGPTYEAAFEACREKLPGGGAH